MFALILGFIDSILRNNGLLWALSSNIIGFWVLFIVICTIISPDFENTASPYPYNVLKTSPRINALTTELFLEK